MIGKPFAHLLMIEKYCQVGLVEFEELLTPRGIEIRDEVSDVATCDLAKSCHCNDQAEHCFHFHHAAGAKIEEGFF